MAYNPFDFFRRNQKILFAMITIMVMFMFVLSSGVGGRGADFFQWFPDWLGSKRGVGGDTVATVEGKAVSTVQLALLERQRTQVNDLMAALADRARTRLGKQLGDAAGKADRESPIANFLQTRQTGYMSQQTQFQFQIMQMQGQQVTQDMMVNAVFREMSTQAQRLASITESTLSKPEDLQLAKLASTLLQLDTLRMSPQFFPTADLKSKAGSLEFDLWRRKADKLGITIAPAEAEAMALAELGGAATADDIRELHRDLQSRDPSLSSDKLRTALADEFRVRLAQQAVNGTSGASDAAGGQFAGAPYQQFRYYQQQTNESRYAMLRLPVENFLDKVTGEPTPQEVSDLFNKYRTLEPSPFVDRPGFKEPRKLKLEWLSAQGNEPFYKAAAETLQPQTELQTRLQGLLLAPLGGTIVPVVAGPALLAIKTEDTLAGAYDEYKRLANQNIDSVWGLTFPTNRPDITDETFAQPKTLAALAATMAGGLMGHAHPAMGPLVFLERARIDERNAKARAQASLMLLPLPGSLPMLGGAAAMAARMPQPLPLAVLKPGTEVKLREKLATQILENDLSRFRTELAKLGKGIDKASARNFLEAFVKERGLPTGTSTEFRDQYSIDRDPGLAPVFERFKKIFPEQNQARRTWLDGLDFFGPRFFSRGNNTQTTFYDPEQFAFRNETEPSVYIWRTAEQLGEEPKDANEPKTKAKIVAAWKQAKARELAKAKADEIAKDAGTFGTNTEVLTQKLIDLEAKLKLETPGTLATNKIRYFEIPNVAPMRITPTFSLDRPTVQEFQLFPSDNIVMPTREIFNGLLDNRDKPIGTAFVQPDMPKENYFVGVLVGKDVHTTGEFARSVFERAGMRLPGAAGDLSQVIGESFAQESRLKSRERAINLLKAEFKVDNLNEKLLAERGEN